MPWVDCGNGDDEPDLNGWPRQSPARQWLDDYDPYLEEQLRADFEKKVTDELHRTEKTLMGILKACGGSCSFRHLYAHWMTELERIEVTLLRFLEQSHMSCPKEELRGWHRIQNSKTTADFNQYLQNRSHVFVAKVGFHHARSLSNWQRVPQCERIVSHHARSEQENTDFSLFGEGGLEDDLLDNGIVELCKTTDRGFAQFLDALGGPAKSKRQKGKKSKELENMEQRLEDACIKHLQMKSCSIAELMSLPEWKEGKKKKSYKMSSMVPLGWKFLTARPHLFELVQSQDKNLQAREHFHVVLRSGVETSQKFANASLGETLLSYGLPDT